jgi:hypothetical protein
MLLISDTSYGCNVHYSTPVCSVFSGDKKLYFGMMIHYLFFSRISLSLCRDDINMSSCIISLLVSCGWNCKRWNSFLPSLLMLQIIPITMLDPFCNFCFVLYYADIGFKHTCTVFESFMPASSVESHIKNPHIMKMAVFWVFAPCSLVEVYRSFRGACCLHQQGDDGGSKDLRNVGKLLPDYTALQPWRQPSWIINLLGSFITVTTTCRWTAVLSGSVFNFVPLRLLNVVQFVWWTEISAILDGTSSGMLSLIREDVNNGGLYSSCVRFRGHTPAWFYCLRQTCRSWATRVRCLYNDVLFRVGGEVVFASDLLHFRPFLL